MHDDPLDRLIDSALHSYAAPTGGLERRVLIALAAERASAPSRWFARPRTWIFSGALAACAMLALFLATRPLQHPAQPQQIAHTTTPAPITQPLPAPPASHTAAPHSLVTASAKHSHARQHHPEPLPKQQLFPTPQPLSPQIQALMQFAAHAPTQQRQALLHAQIDAPIDIAPLRIAPLNVTSQEESSPQQDR